MIEPSNQSTNKLTKEIIMKKPITKKEFVQQHAELKKMFKDVKKALRVVHQLTKPLVKRASKLYKKGDTLYIEEDGKPIRPSFKTLPKLMDDLEFWRTIDVDLTF